MIPEAGFEVVLRGYDRHEVDSLVDVVQPALRTDDPSVHAEALKALASPTFAVRMRGYNKRQVDDFIISAQGALRHQEAG